MRLLCVQARRRRKREVLQRLVLNVKIEREERGASATAAVVEAVGAALLSPPQPTPGYVEYDANACAASNSIDEAGSSDTVDDSSYQPFDGGYRELPRCEREEAQRRSSKRFALVVQDGEVKYKAVDEGSIELETTSAEQLANFLKAGGIAEGPPVGLIAGGSAIVFLLLVFINFFGSIFG